MPARTHTEPAEQRHSVYDDCEKQKLDRNGSTTRNLELACREKEVPLLVKVANALLVTGPICVTSCLPLGPSALDCDAIGSAKVNALVSAVCPAGGNINPQAGTCRQATGVEF